MTVDEIKKDLYKKKPTAKLVEIHKGVAVYTTMLVYADAPYFQGVRFEVPVSDMGDTSFEAEIPAQLLNRWIVDLN